MLTIRYVAEYSLRCERCRAESTGHATRALLFAWARSEGWHVVAWPDGRAPARCATCARLAGLPAGVVPAVNPRGARGRRELA